MTNKISSTAYRRAIGMLLLIYAFCVMIVFSPVYKMHTHKLTLALLGDLLITAPFLYYVAVRRSTVSKQSVIRVFIIGLFIAGLILNPNSNPVLHFLKTWISPVVELMMIIFVIRKFRSAQKIAANNDVDFLISCRNVLKTVIVNEKIGNIISSEIAVFYYAFSINNKKADYINSFSTYKENGIMPVFGAVLFIFIAEAAGMHFLFRIWSETAAWILTGLSIYTCLQLFAHIRAVKARNVVISERSLFICSGLAGDACIELQNIASFEWSTKKPGCKAEKIALLKGIENHNMIIYLKKPIVITKIFGILKKNDTIIFFTDNPEKFSASLNKALNNFPENE